MGKKYYETNEFKRLNKEWSGKLKDSGFRDVETEHDKNNGTTHKDHFQVDSERLAYFKQCEAFLRSGKIKDPLDLFIFENHCEGISNRKTSEMLKTKGLKELHEASVDRRVLKLLEMAGIESIVFSF